MKNINSSSISNGVSPLGGVGIGSNSSIISGNNNNSSGGGSNNFVIGNMVPQQVVGGGIIHGGGLIANVPIGTVPQPPPPTNIIHNCVSIDEMEPSKETIFFEYIPRILYTKQVLNGSTVDIGSDSGVVMIIMLNGDVFFYPSNVSLLDQLPDIFLNSPNSNNSQSSSPAATSSSVNNSNNSNNNKSNKQNKNNLKSKYNIPLNLSPDHKVFSFDFKQVDPNENYVYTTDNSPSSSTTSSANNSDNEDDFDNNSNNNRQNNNHHHHNNSENSNQFIDFIPVRYRRPRKILVSNDKRLLMIIGNFIKGVSSLTIYRIMEEGPHYFQLLFYDSSFTYVDACFSSDSTTMAAILARYPNFIFVLQIPGLLPKQVLLNNPNTPNNNNNINNNSINKDNININNNNNNEKFKFETSLNYNFGFGNSEYRTNFVDTVDYQEKRVSFESRVIGPIAIVGPVQNCLGEPYHMTHIASNPNLSDEKLKPFEFITWNDDSLGEFCFWNIHKSKKKSKSTLASTSTSTSTPTTAQQPSNTTSSTSTQQQQNNINNNSPLKNIPQLKFEWMTKFINPITVEKNQIDKEKIPKSYIISMEFSPNGDLVMAIVRRENHDQKNSKSNGIGIQCIPTTLDLLNYGNPFYPDGSAYNNSINNLQTTNYQNYYKGFNLLNINNNNNNKSQNKSNSNINNNNNTNSINSNTINNNINTVGGGISSQWFQISESNDKSIIIASKWSDSLFFGSETQYLPAVLIKEKGIFELISNNHCAQFTNSSEEFMKTCVNFIQMGKYHRLWISTYGILYSITMTPKNDKYIEWVPTVCDSNNLNYTKYQKVSQMIGYTLLNDFSNNSSSLPLSSSISSSNNSSSSTSNITSTKDLKNPNKKKSDESIKQQHHQQQQSSNSTTATIREHSGNGDAEVYSCLHLYKCWSCKLTLIKPLICGFCKSVAYCSRDCQKDHWLTHRDQCIIPSFPIINNHIQLQQLQYQHQQSLQQQTLQRLNYQQNNKL